MPPAKHAILGPSAASRWFVCTKSARLEQSFPSVEGDAAAEGTLAHSLAELIIEHRRQLISNKEFRAQLKLLKDNKFYNQAMYEYCDDYAVYVLEQYGKALATCPDAKLLIEERLELTEFVPDGFGTGDAGIVSDDVVDVIDLKYGKGVKVDVVDNKQLKIYALGWLRGHAYLYNVKIVRLHIYQPRIGNIASWEISYDDLMQWAEQELKPHAALAFNGEGEYVPGKHCQFCKAKTTCKANAEYQLSIAQEDFKDILFDQDPELVSPDLLKPEEVSRILGMAEGFKNWVEAVKDYALEQAKQGVKWPGYKLVEGRSQRTMTDMAAVEKLLVKHQFDRSKIFKPQELVGITELEKVTGRRFFDEHLTQYTIKPQGAPTLAPISDPRKEYRDANSDFADIEVE